MVLVVLLIKKKTFKNNITLIGYLDTYKLWYSYITEKKIHSLKLRKH